MSRNLMFTLFLILSFSAFAQEGRPVSYEYVTDDTTSAFAQDAQMWNAFWGRLNTEECRLDYARASEIGCNISGANSGIRISADSQASQLYNYAESEVFVDLTTRLQSVNDCQLTLVDSYLPRQGSSTASSPVVQEQINERVINKFNTYRNDFMTIRNEIRRLQSERQRLFGGVTNASGSGSTTPFRQDGGLTQKIQELEAAQELLIREFPFGNQESVKEQLLMIVRRDGDLSINNFRAAFNRGMSTYQSQLASSSRRLDWALASPTRADRYRDLQSRRCNPNLRRRTPCPEGSFATNDQERRDLSYGDDVGAPGITNEFKQQLLGGDLSLVEEYFTAVGQGAPASNAMLCQIRANHIQGAAIESGAKIALEIAGVVALSVAFPPAGAAASATATGARTAAMAGRLAGLATRTGARTVGSYALSMTPLIPSVARGCMRNDSPAFVNYANFNAGSQCSVDNSLSFTNADSQFAECATEIAFASLEALAGLGIGRAILDRISRRTAREAGESIVTSTADDAARAARRNDEGLESIQSNPQASRANVGQQEPNYAPITVPQRVGSDQVQRSYIAQVNNLRERGITFTEQPSRITTLDGNIRRGQTQLVTNGGQAEFKGRILRIDNLPPSVRRGNANTNAFEHPEMQRYMEQMREWGYDLVVDTGIPFTGSGAYFWEHTRVIALRPDTNWQTFLHEFQHLEFERFARRRIPEMRRDNFRFTDPYSNAAFRSLSEEMGRARANRLVSLLRRGHTELAVNETLSVQAELRALGFRRFVPGQGSHSRLYAIRHQINGLQEIAATRALTSTEQRALNQALRNYRLVNIYNSNTGALAVGATGGAAIAAGGIGTYVALSDSESQAASADAAEYQQIIYNERGVVFGQKHDGTWITLSNP